MKPPLNTGTTCAMIVMKFGGTSVQDASAIESLAGVVASRRGSKIVIVSALSGVTDKLLELTRLCETQKKSDASSLLKVLKERHLKLAVELECDPQARERLEEVFDFLKGIVVALCSLGEVSPRFRDTIAAQGELCSSIIVESRLRQSGMKSKWFDSREHIRTDSCFGMASVDFDETNRLCQIGLKPQTEIHEVMLGQGFIGSDSKGVTTTLGRGGSDYSAAIFGAVLAANTIEIWTDVDGVLTTDPRLVPSARRLGKLSFREAAELAFFGAKVLHPATLQPAIQKNIPVFVLNSRNPNAFGTEITGERVPHSNVVKAIAFKRKVVEVQLSSMRMLGAHGFLKAVFEIFARHGLSVDLIATSEVNLSLTLDPSQSLGRLDEAVTELRSLAEVELSQDQSVISVVGDGIRSMPGVGGRIFEALKNVNVRMISMGGSEFNLSLVVKDSELEMAVKSLHDEFFEKLPDDEVFQSL